MEAQWRPASDKSPPRCRQAHVEAGASRCMHISTLPPPVQARWMQCRWRLGAGRCMHASTCACTMPVRGGGSAGGVLVHTGACESMDIDNISPEEQPSP